MLYSQGLEYDWPTAKAQELQMNKLRESDEEKRTPDLGKNIHNGEEAGAHGCSEETVKQV